MYLGTIQQMDVCSSRGRVYKSREWSWCPVAIGHKKLTWEVKVGKSVEILGRKLDRDWIGITVSHVGSNLYK